MEGGSERDILMELDRNKEGGRDREIEEGRERVRNGSQRGR